MFVYERHVRSAIDKQAREREENKGSQDRAAVNTIPYH